MLGVGLISIHGAYWVHWIILSAPGHRHFFLVPLFGAGPDARNCGIVLESFLYGNFSFPLSIVGA